jgi:hypothetical protein
MNNLVVTSHQPATTKPDVDPDLRLAIHSDYTDEQIAAASRPPSLEAVFAAHLRLLALQDAERCSADR